MLDKFLKNPGNRRSLLLKIILFTLISVSVLLCCFSVLKAKKFQKTAVYENAVAYAGIMDRHTAKEEQAGDSLGHLKDVLTQELSFASSLSTFVVLQEDRVLSTEGYSPLSWKLVAAVSELARRTSSEVSDPSEAVYTYRDLSLPDFYFCYVPSQTDGLGYCYYEPVLTGRALVRQSFFNFQGFLLLLLLAAALPVLFLLSASPDKRQGKQGGSQQTADGAHSKALQIDSPQGQGMQSGRFQGTDLQSGNLQDTESRNGKPIDAVSRDSSLQNTESRNSSTMDPDSRNSSLQDTKNRNGKPADAGSRNCNLQDTEPRNGKPVDTGSRNSSLQNTEPWYAAPQNGSPQNTAPRNCKQQNSKSAGRKNDNPRKEKQETSDVFGSRPYFSGIIIDYYNTKGTSVSPDTLELFDRIICENLSVSKILFQQSSQRCSDCLQYYMNYNTYNLRVLSDSLKMNLYNAAPEYAINIFYSNAVSTRQEMENELLYLHQQLRYSLLLGYNLRLSIRQIRSFESSQEKMDVGVASTIQNHLRTRAYEDLYGYLRRYRDACTHFARPGSTPYSFSEIYRFAEESFSAVKLFFQENDFTHPMVETSCITVLRANPGFGHFCDYLISSIQSYQQENQHVLSSRNEQIMNSIYMYIEQDLADANLNSIARKMQMTDSHLSRVFKKNTGTNFSEYLSDRKLEEAAKLLVQDNKIKVADIADMLGYGNPTYFLSRFKAKYGVSPTAYRKLHMTE